MDVTHSLPRMERLFHPGHASGLPGWGNVIGGGDPVFGGKVFPYPGMPPATGIGPWTPLP